jgi:uncharacterized membrane protein required for colicin V production
MKNLPFNYVDVIIVVLLIAGIFRGRKRGMSEELLTFVQWLIIVFVGGQLYLPGGRLLSQMAPLSILTCNVIAYVTFAIVVKTIFTQIQRACGEKLLGSNFFGVSEYYLGMLAGMIRFGCVILMVMALFNARLITDQERAETAKMQSKNFEGISFPTFGSIQQSILFESFNGKQVKEHLEDYVLIRSTALKVTPLRREENKAMNDILGK